MCAATVERGAGCLEGVVSVEADYIQGTATVTYDPAQTSPEQIIVVINEQTFYRASLPEPGMALRSQSSGGRISPIFYLILAGGLGFLVAVWYRRRWGGKPEEIPHG